MMPHDDEAQDADMIKSVLQKIINQMDQLESNRIMPDARKPKEMAAHVDIAAKPEGSPEEESMESPDDESSEMKPEVLNELMSKADQADDSGALPEDQMHDFHPKIAALIAAKKKPV